MEIDLRGMTGDEAEAAALAALDAAVLADRPYLRIIHGKGTGVVRDRVQRLLSRDAPGAEPRLCALEPGRHRRHRRGVEVVSAIPDDVIEQVRDTADIVSIVGESVDLKRTGSD